MSNYQRVMHESSAAVAGPDDELHLRFWALAKPRSVFTFPDGAKQAAVGEGTSTASRNKKCLMTSAQGAALASLPCAECSMIFTDSNPLGY